MTNANHPENPKSHGLHDLGQMWISPLESKACVSRETQLTNPEAIEGLPEFIGPHRKVWTYNAGQADTRCITGCAKPYCHEITGPIFKWIDDPSYGPLDAPERIPAGSTRSHIFTTETDNDLNIFPTTILRGFPKFNTNP